MGSDEPRGLSPPLLRIPAALTSQQTRDSIWDPGLTEEVVNEAPFGLNLEHSWIWIHAGGQQCHLHIPGVSGGG